MARPLDEKFAELPAARRDRIEARAAELIAEEMSLRDLRRALGKTQVKVASDLGVGQDNRHRDRADAKVAAIRPKRKDTAVRTPRK